MVLAFMENTKAEPTGRAKGGIARRDKLSPQRRSEIARNAALSKRPLRAIRKGNFKEKLGVSVDCYVLNDERKTAVITQSGIGIILGLGDGGSRLPRFILSPKMSVYVGPELRKKIENPLVFHGVSSGQNDPTGGFKANGYDASVLIETCQAIISASADGKNINPEVVKQASIIVSSSANLGIQGLIYAITGFDRTHEETITAFQRFVAEEARKYEKEFPTELYLAWARLYGIPEPERGRNWKHMHLTVDHIYMPLAKSDGKLLTLLREAKSNTGERNAKLFQFLNEIGARALRMQLGRVLEMAESSSIAESYEARIEERFGNGQLRLEFSSASGPSA
jgi:voltage-gated potassium channel Kch